MMHNKKCRKRSKTAASEAHKAVEGLRAAGARTRVGAVRILGVAEAIRVAWGAWE